MTTLARGAAIARSLHGRDSADHAALRGLLIQLAAGVAARAEDPARYGAADDVIWVLVGMPTNGFPTADEADRIQRVISGLDASTPQCWYRIADLLDSASEEIGPDAEDAELLGQIAGFFA